MNTQRHIFSRRIIATLALLTWVYAFSGNVRHESRERHAICPQDGGVVHVGGEQKPISGVARVASPSPAGQHHHDCTWDTCLIQHGIDVSANTPGSLGVHATDFAIFPLLRADATVEILRFAPKNSPPIA